MKQRGLNFPGNIVKIECLGKMRNIITIDGPAASGKSTVAGELARRLGWRYLDSGAFYRALAWKALRKGVPLNKPEALSELAGKSEIDLTSSPEGLRILVDGRDVTQAIRQERVSEAASILAELPQVRQALVALQQHFAAQGKVVAEGRDMGTVVFPRARFKFFLDAELEERTRRRYKELISRGERASLNEVKSELAQRDERDSTRSAAPLAQAKDALYVDSTHLAVDEVIDLLLSKIKLAKTSKNNK
jgi:cytidylate kinase